MTSDTLKTFPSIAKKTLKIALVEDQLELRESWSKLISSFPDFTCICTCSSGEEALSQIPTIQPDVILMDIFLPKMSGIECTARIKELLPKTQIVILTASDDEEMVFQALAAGADGYLLKQTKPAELRVAILDVLNGGAPMTSEIARHVVHHFRQKPKVRDESLGLSAREEEVLVLLSRGYSNKEIAEQLVITVDTVCSHLKRIYEKMHVRSRTAAVMRYIASKT